MAGLNINEEEPCHSPRAEMAGLNMDKEERQISIEKENMIS
jgi:hypothetical protein